ncbi:MAG: hypothetical protein GY838_15135 [bacterium]|nr:hypothetical protein [bacterium]
MKLDGSDVHRITTLDGTVFGSGNAVQITDDEFHPSYTVDGEWIVYYSDVSGYRRIYIVDTGGSAAPVALTDEPEGRFKTSNLIVP